MSTTRQWTETRSGLQPLVVAHRESDTYSVRCSSVQTDRRFLPGSHRLCLRFVAQISKFPTDKQQFISSFEDLVRTQSEVPAPFVEKWSHQRLENMLMRNIKNLGLKWVAAVDFPSLKMCLQLQNCCPLSPHVQIAIEIDDGSPCFRVESAMFCARKFGGRKLHDDLGIVQIKEEFVSSYVRHESFLKVIDCICWSLFPTIYNSVPPTLHSK